MTILICRTPRWPPLLAREACQSTVPYDSQSGRLPWGGGSFCDFQSIDSNYIRPSTGGGVVMLTAEPLEWCPHSFNLRSPNSIPDPLVLSDQLAAMTDDMDHGSACLSLPGRGYVVPVVLYDSREMVDCEAFSLILIGWLFISQSTSHGAVSRNSLDCLRTAGSFNTRPSTVFLWSRLSGRYGVLLSFYALSLARFGRPILYSILPHMPEDSAQFNCWRGR
jgi:hypothetical protein